jgi:hypothetical protein
MKFQHKKSFDCSSFGERERGGGVEKKHLQKCINLYILHPHPQEKKKGSTLHSSHWLHENSIPKLGCHYF